MSIYLAVQFVFPTMEDEGYVASPDGCEAPMIFETKLFRLGTPFATYYGDDDD